MKEPSQLPEETPDKHESLDSFAHANEATEQQATARDCSKLGHLYKDG